MAQLTRPSLTTRQAIAIALLTLLGFGVVLAIVLLWGRDGGTAFDVWWNTAINQIHTPLLTEIALVLNFIGGGVGGAIIIPALVSVPLLLLRRYWAVLLLIVASIVCYGAVEIVKHAVARPRPEDMMVPSDFGSFPSGHSSNAMVVALVLSLVFFQRWWVHIVGTIYVAIMMLSRTYLHEHWLTDTIGGALLGASATLAVWACVRKRVLREEPEGQQ